MLVILLAVVWSVFWTGLGLWHSARNKQQGWFVAMLLLNTLGLLPIIYLLWFRLKVSRAEDLVEEEKRTARMSGIKRKIKKKNRR